MERHGGRRGRGNKHRVMYDAPETQAQAQPSQKSVFSRLGLANGGEVLSASAPEFTPPGSTGAWKQSQQPQHEAKRDERAVYKPQRQRQKQQKQQGGSQEKENRPNEAGAGELRTRKDRRGGERVAPKPGLRVRPPSQKRNTVNFTPTTARPDLRLVLGERGQSYGSKPTPWDCVLVPGFAAERHDMTVYENLLAEIKATGRDDIFCLWHGDSHVIANDRKGWKGNCPTFDRLVKQVADYFGMTVNATRLNWYRDDAEWKPFHFDRAAFTPGCPQNFTVGISLGPSTRDIAFEHAEKGATGRGVGGTTVALPQPNGSAYAFSEFVNIEWRHGVPQVAEHARNPGHEGRISIICWGQLELDSRE